MTIGQDFDILEWADEIIDSRTFHARDDLVRAWHGGLLAVAERCEDGVAASQALAVGAPEAMVERYRKLEKVWLDLYFAALDLPLADG